MHTGKPGPDKAFDRSTGDETTVEPTRPGRGVLRDIGHELLTSILPAVVLALLLTHFVAQGTLVYGQSMEPNLHNQQHIIIEKISHRFDALERGDVVVIDVDHSEIPLVKRVIGLPGETIEIKKGQVFIDGVLLEEPYLNEVPRQNYGPVEIPNTYIFVLGDNRGASNDSRYFGPVPIERIIGKAWFSYWPLEYFGQIK
jgi:signal peptidase I